MFISKETFLVRNNYSNKEEKLHAKDYGDGVPLIRVMHPKNPDLFHHLCPFYVRLSSGEYRMDENHERVILLLAPDLEAFTVAYGETVWLEPVYPKIRKQPI